MEHGGSRRQWFWVFFAGVLLTQLAWTVALPAYRGIDEFDHVYKANAVAHGELISRTPAPAGRGNLVEVEPEIVYAARYVCAWYRYTKPDNCRPVGPERDGLRHAASAAALYDPVWYAVVGLPTRILDGEHVIYGIRFVSGLICALLIGWGAAVTRRWSRRPVALMAYAAALSPVLVYSTAIASPNGVGYSAALLVWAALIGARREGRLTPAYAVPLAVGAVVELVTHSTGPLWLALIAVVVVPLQPVRDWWAMVRASRLATSVVVSVVLLATAGSVAWTLWSGANQVGSPDPEMPVLTGKIVLREILLWQLQSIAAFPTRNEAAPVVVYACWALIFLVVVVWALRVASTRLRVAFGVLAVLAVVVPAALLVRAWDFAGSAWQGRYTLPLTVGFLMLAADALDRADVRPSPALARVLATLAGVAVLAGVGHIGRIETNGMAPGTPPVGHVPFGWELAAVLAGLATAVPLLAVGGALRREPRD